MKTTLVIIIGILILLAVIQAIGIDSNKRQLSELRFQILELQELAKTQACKSASDSELQKAFESGQIFFIGWQQCQESYGITNGTMHEIFAHHYRP